MYIYLSNFVNFAKMDKKRVLIAGGSGFIGKNLYVELWNSKYDVFILSRNRKLCTRPDFIYWAPENEIIEADGPLHFDCLINLCGEGIATKRWTAARKKVLMESRITPTRFIDSLVRSGRLSITDYIGSSAIGIYGDRPGTSPCNETDVIEPKSFLADLCSQWEAAHLSLPESVRKVILRIGLVLADEGGLLDQYRPLLSMRMVPYFGGGIPYMSWITAKDLCRMILFIMEHPKTSGIYNAVADQPVISRDFAKAFIKSSGKKAFARGIPGFALKWMMGEQALLVLESQYVSNKKIRMEGFRCLSTDISTAFG
ncbi:MAG: NAD-dependent epimerase [Candidatus Parvibacillus calidus]|nr:MAG: NAD-dependent epimerase [Candidatus Parvibacillus calidus]